MSALNKEQRGVAIAMAAALIVTIMALAFAVTADHAAAAVPFADRLQHTLRLDLFVVIWLMATIGNVARLRFFSERDIAGSGSDEESSKVRQARAILQNTLEQVAFAVMTHMIVAAVFDKSTALITALVLLFAVGRLLFWTGFRYGARRRAFGFGLTFYPSVLALITSAVAADMI